MRRSLNLVAVVGAALLLGLLATTGCTLGEPSVPLAEDPVPVPGEPPSSIPTSAPDAPAAETAVGEVGEIVEAGPWRVVVRVAALAGADAPEADDESRLELELDVTNTSSEPLRVTPGDFTLVSGSATIFPEEDGGGLVTVREVAAGATESLAGRFELSPSREGEPLGLVFVPVEGGPTRIEIRIEAP